MTPRPYTSLWFEVVPFYALLATVIVGPILLERAFRRRREPIQPQQVWSEEEASEVDILVLHWMRKKRAFVVSTLYPSMDPLVTYQTSQLDPAGFPTRFGVAWRLYTQAPQYRGIDDMPGFRMWLWQPETEARVEEEVVASLSRWHDDRYERGVKGA